MAAGKSRKKKAGSPKKRARAKAAASTKRKAKAGSAGSDDSSESLRAIAKSFAARLLR
jgi:hypothetical protein